jgi:serine/threonine-protein kinase
MAPTGGFSLATRIFLTTALLVLLAVGSAVAVTYLLGDRIAQQAVQDQLRSSHSMQASSQQQRFQQLQLSASLFATEPAIRVYIAEATGNQEAMAEGVASVLDLFAERQPGMGFDFAILLDPRGRVFARSDQPGATGQDLSRQSLVAAALEKNQAAGVWQEEGKLYDAVAVPVVQGFALQGFVVFGYAIGGDRAAEVKRSSGTEVAFLSNTPAGPVVAASTLEPALANTLVAALRGRGAALRQATELGEAVDQVEVRLGGRPWMALLSPLRDAADRPVGASVALASRDRAARSYRQIMTVLGAVGLASVVLAALLSWALSRRALRPVRQLAAAAEAARQGNYDQRLGIERRDEVGKLAHSFDVLLSDLREKRDMEAYVAELSRSLPSEGPSGGGGAWMRPEARRVTLLAVELRGYARRRVTVDPAETLDRLARDLRRVATAIGARRGRLQGLFGHRLLASFEGESGAHDAVGAASEIVAELGAERSALDEAEPPLAAIAAGEAVTGSVIWEERPEHAVVGLPVQQLESLLREATPGDILLSADVHEELRGTLGQAGIELSAQRGLLSSQPVFLLRADLAARLTGSQAQPTVATGAAGPPAASASTLAAIAPGAMLGNRFQILSVLGAGGMGVVYKARDQELDDMVALKVLKREVAGDRERLERLKSELKLARKITHPNVLRTFDFGELDGIPFISMEYVRGVTLRYLLDRQGRLPYSAGLRVAKQLCAGLAVAHAQGVIHRDIKPENLILDPTGNVKLMDFGIARPIERLTPGQTQAGFVVGTPHYLSPEQLTGKDVDPRADIYACGVVLYEIFTGRRPFDGDSPAEIVLAHLQQPPARPSTHWPEIPAELERSILRCLEKDRDRRYSNVVELRKDLDGLSA